MQRIPIEWVRNPDGSQGYTWNPVTGCLQEEKGFKPVFHPERLADPQKVKKPSTVFVCSMADLFGEWVPVELIEKVLEACTKAQQHLYLFLTKNPTKYYSLRFRQWPGQYMVGVTCTKGYAPKTGHGRIVSFVSCEPILGPIRVNPVFFSWVIVGAQTGPGAVKPKREWVEEIIKTCKENNIPLFLKNNLLKIHPDFPRIQEVPWTQ